MYDGIQYRMQYFFSGMAFFMIGLMASMQYRMLFLFSGMEFRLLFEIMFCCYALSQVFGLPEDGVHMCFQGILYTL